MKALKPGVFLWLLILTAGLMPGQTAPVIFYSDLDGGPNSGGQSEAGAIVSVYGEGFGATQGSSYITIGGGRASSYLMWTETRVAFQLGSAAATGDIVITTSAGISNGVPFTIRHGNIYFVSTGGSDSNSGSDSAPWLTLLHARDSMQPGDIAYALNGVTQSTDDGSGWSTCMVLDGEAGNSGSAGLPMAMVVYPGATATIGNVNGTAAGGCDAAVRAKGNGENYWIFAGFTVRGGTITFDPYGDVGWRIIDNDMSCPNGNDAAGCLDIQYGITTCVYGNTIHDVATNLSPGNVTALYQGVYISAHNTGLDFGWNTIARVQGCRGLQQNVNSGEGGSSFDLHIHDNVIHDTQCDGIVMTTVDPSQGTVELYNNIIYNAGTGPNNTEGTGNWACLYLEGYSLSGSESGAIKVYNNTLYNCGTFANPPYGGANAGVQWNTGGNPNKSVQLTDNIIYPPTFVPYLIVYDAGGSQCSLNCPQIAGSNNLMFNAGAPPSDRYLTDTVNANPLFVNLAAPNFHLQAGSPAATAGAITPDVRDFDGVPLPQGAGDPIGAYALPIPVQSTPDGDSFQKLNPLSFAMQEGGPDPRPQTFTVTSTGLAFCWSGFVKFFTGDGWLQLSGSDCTPSTITAAIVDATNLPVGTYTAQWTLTNGTATATVPITLTVGPRLKGTLH